MFGFDAVGFVHVTEDVNFWFYFKNFIKECPWANWLSVEGDVQDAERGCVGDENVELLGDWFKNSLLVLLCILKGTFSTKWLRKRGAEYLHSFNLHFLVLKVYAFIS